MHYMKMIPSERSVSAEREIKAYGVLHNDSIPRLFCVRRYSGGTCLWLTYFPGETLGEMVRRGRRFSVDEVINVGIQLCDVLDCMHSNRPERVFHLDLHPDNLVICNGRLRIIDFGNSWCGTGRCVVGKLSGTPRFSAPELRRGGEIDQTADIFSAGKILMYMMDFVENGRSRAEAIRKLGNAAAACVREEPAYRIRQAGDLGDILREIKGNFDLGEHAGSPAGIRRMRMPEERL